MSFSQHYSMKSVMTLHDDDEDLTDSHRGMSDVDEEESYNSYSTRSYSKKPEFADSRATTDETKGSHNDVHLHVDGGVPLDNFVRGTSKSRTFLEVYEANVSQMLTQAETKLAFSDVIVDHELRRTYSSDLPTKKAKAERVRNKRSIRIAQMALSENLNEYTEYRMFDWWDFNVQDFEEYGLGIGLYFSMLRQLCILMVIMSISAIPALVFSATWGGISTFHAARFPFDIITLGNFGDASVRLASDLEADLRTIEIWGVSISRQAAIMTISVFDVLGTVICLLYVLYLNKESSEIVSKYNREVIGISHYTALVWNIPDDFTDRNKLAKWFETRYGIVAELTIIYGQPDVFKLYTRRGRLRQRIMKMEQNKDENNASLRDLRAEVLRIDDELEEAKTDDDPTNDSVKKTLCAFVIFEDVTSRERCVEDSNLTWNKKTKDVSSKLEFRNKFLRVEPAHQPSNTYFENFRYTLSEKRWRRVATFLMSTLIICFAIGGAYYSESLRSTDVTGSGSTSDLRYTCPRFTAEQVPLHVNGNYNTTCYCLQLGLEKMLEQKEVDCQRTFDFEIQTSLLSLGSVAGIVLINFLLLFTASKLGKFEKHLSISMEELSISSKLFWGLFLNTGIILLLVNANFDDYTSNSLVRYFFAGRYNDFQAQWFTSVGVTVTITMIFNTMNPHLLPLLLIPYHACRRAMASESLPQETLNEIFVGPRFEPAERHAIALTTFFISMFYGGGLPIFYFIAAFTFFITYVFDKTSFLYLYRIPNKYDNTLYSHVLRMLPWAFFLHLCMSLWFYTAPMFFDVFKKDAGFVTKNKYFDIDAIPTAGLFERMQQTQALPIVVALVLIGLVLLINEILVLFKCRNRYSAIMEEAALFRPLSVVKELGANFESYALHRSTFYAPAYVRTPSGKQLAPDLTLDELRIATDPTATEAAQLRDDLSVEGDLSESTLSENEGTWEEMKCVNTGKTFWFNALSLERSDECPFDSPSMATSPRSYVSNGSCIRNVDEWAFDVEQPDYVFTQNAFKLYQRNHKKWRAERLAREEESSSYSDMSNSSHTSDEDSDVSMVMDTDKGQVMIVKDDEVVGSPEYKEIMKQASRDNSRINSPDLEPSPRHRRKGKRSDPKAAINSSDDEDIGIKSWTKHKRSPKYRERKIKESRNKRS